MTLTRCFGCLSRSQIYVSGFLVFVGFFFHIYFTVNLKITTLGSRSSSLWHKQYNTSLLIHRDSWILPSAVIAELSNNSVSLDMLFSCHTGKENSLHTT